MTEAQIRAECMRLDDIAKKEALVVYYLSHARGTLKLATVGMYWAGMSEAERWCMVKYGNIFLTLDAAHDAIARALQKEPE